MFYLPFFHVNFYFLFFNQIIQRQHTFIRAYDDLPILFEEQL